MGKVAVRAETGGGRQQAWLDSVGLERQQECMPCTGETGGLVVHGQLDSSCSQARPY